MLRDNHFSSGAGMYVRYFVPEMKPARWHRKIIGVFSGNYKTIDANGQTKIVSSSFKARIHGPKSRTARTKEHFLSLIDEDREDPWFKEAFNLFECMIERPQIWVADNISTVLL